MKPPKIAIEQLKAVRDLCDSSPIGILRPEEVAKCLNINQQAFRIMIEAGQVPFAVGRGAGRGMSRGNYYIPVAPFWRFMSGQPIELEDDEEEN